MKLDKLTVAILQNFASINTNLVIKSGKKITTMAVTRDIMAEFDGDIEFDKTVSIFNLNELLGVHSTFDNPEIDLDDKFLVVKEGKQKVKYIYADESLLVTPNKAIIMPTAEINFELSAENLSKIQKMASVLAVNDLSFIGNGKKIIARVHDTKNPTGNSFDIDLETKTTDNFDIQFKIEKLKLFAGQTYTVAISSKKISCFTAKDIKLVVYIAVEATSTFS